MMKRIREVKQLGGTKAIKLYPSDMIDFKLKVGDKVIIDDIIKCDAQDIVDSVEYPSVEKLNSENASENISNILTKQRRDEDGKPIQA